MAGRVFLGWDPPEKGGGGSSAPVGKEGAGKGGGWRFEARAKEKISFPALEKKDLFLPLLFRRQKSCLKR